MSDWFFRERRDQLINWMGVDSWIDSSLASAWQGLQERWNAASSFFARFRLSGWKRGLSQARVDTGLVAYGDFTPESGAAAMADLLEQAPDLDELLP